MLQRQFRLPANTRLTSPLTYRTALFMVKISRTDSSENRFGFVVKKALDKRAVVRNRIRRVFRSCIEVLQDKIVSGHDMLFFLEKGILDIPHEELQKELDAFFQEKKLLK